MTALDYVTVLRAHERRMAKAYILATNGVVTRRTDANAEWFTGEVRPVNGIGDIHQLLLELEGDPFACVIRAAPAEGVDLRETRRRKNGKSPPFVETPRRWVMVDIDDVKIPGANDILGDPAGAAGDVLDMLAAHAPELEGIAAVVQFSSSAALGEVAEAEEASGFPPRWRDVVKSGVSAHVWFWLTSPYGEADLTRWAAAVNAGGGKLVDPVAMRTIQPHFVAAPIFGQGLRDPLAGRRTLFIPGAVAEATLNIPAVKPRSYTAEAGEGTAHGGRGYAGHLADIGGADGFRAPMLRAVAAFVTTNWPEPDLAALRRDIRARIDAADPGGRSQAVLDEYAGRGLDQLITWTMEREKEKREAQAAERRTAHADPTFPNRGVPLVEAEAQAEAAVLRFADRLRGGEKPELLLQMTVGAGKSEAAIRRAPDLLQAARDGGREGALVYLVPRLDLSDELVERFRKAHPALPIATWRGMDAPDPARPGETMCLDPAIPRAAAEAGLAHTAACGVCPRSGECGYRGQGSQRGEILLMAHNGAFHGKPAALPDAALVVIDESFMSAAMVGTDAESRLLLPVGDLEDERTGAVTGEDRGRLLNLRRRARDVLQAQAHEAGGLMRQAFAATTQRKLYLDQDDVLQESFSAAGLTLEDADEWLRLEWDTKPKPDLRGAGDRGAILEKLRRAKAAGFNRRRVTLAKQVRDLLAGNAARSVNAELVDGGAAVAFAWREDFAEWVAEAPKLFLDATTAPELLRVWSPVLEVETIEVEAPLQRVRQIVAEFGRAKFTSNPANVRRLADLVVVELAETNGDVLVVAQAVVEALLLKELKRRFGEIPARLHLAHHGALTGMNTWSNVERVLVVGRPAMNRRDGERLAEIVRGAAVEVVADGEAAHWPTVTGGIRMWDGTGRPVRQPRHEDPLVEALRWTISEGAVLQAIGRGRGVRRRVHVTIMCELALPLTVAAVEQWDEAQPDRFTVAAAEATLTGKALPLAAADLAAARPDLFETAKAVERYREARNNPPQSLIWTLHKRLGGVIPCRYRKVGGRGPASMALVPAIGGRAALEDMLGPLSFFELAEPIAETATTRQALIEPEKVYPVGVLEPPPVDMVAVRGAGGRRVALIEVPGMGPFAGAQAVIRGGLGPWRLLRRPDAPLPVPWLAAAMLAHPPGRHPGRRSGGEVMRH